MTLLKTTNLTRIFGGLAAVSDVSIDIQEQDLVGLIGPNGAGKTTLFNLLTGVYEPSAGTIEFQIKDEMKSIGGMPPYAITKLGIARTFQNIRLFKNLTVLDNVKIAMNQNIKYHTLSAILRLPSYYREEQRVEEMAWKLLDVVHLADKGKELAKNLPYGEQRRLEIARALATEPKLLFLDEPAAGMNPQETKDLTILIRQIQKQFHLTIILIEHDMSLVMSLCEKIYVLDYGKCIAYGSPEEIRNNPRVIEAYLGEDAGC
ncbi:MAG: ABC transporter ATP-binding protein [Erysipelotrichaceae bacterium]|nr:ABC transporter ATP-binding protein [Erysipelotrichaceae bacterium]